MFFFPVWRQTFAQAHRYVCWLLAASQSHRMQAGGGWMDGTPACPRGGWKERSTDEKSLCALWHWPTGVVFSLPSLPGPPPPSALCAAGRERWCKLCNASVCAPIPPFLFSALASFPLLVLFVAGLATRVAVPVVGRVVEEHLVESFEGLGEVVLQGGEGGADGGRAEAVRDEGEVGEAALDAGLQDGAGPGVAQRSPVLGQQVGELLTQLSAEDRRD